MDLVRESSSGAEDSHLDWKIIRHPLYQPRSSPWFDLRVFYIRFSGVEVGDSTPELLSLTHIPLSLNTIVEVNGKRSSIYSESVSSSLRRDRIDRDAAEATFVGTDTIRLTGSTIFEVCCGEDLLLSVTLELSTDDGGAAGEAKGRGKKWNISCRPAAAATANGFLKADGENRSPAAEVFITGSFSGSPIILTKTLQLGLPKKNQRKKTALDAIPEYEEPRPEFKSFLDYGADEDYGGMYGRPEYLDGEGGELSWFNAGVRVGVGLGLGICLGVGLGVGLLARTYTSATKTFKKR